MKLFVSQPMRNKTDEEILKTREKAVKLAEMKYGEKFEIIDSFFGTSDMTRALEYLGESIKMLAHADVAVFVGDWQHARGCKIEHECAIEYGIKTMYF